ncbi:MAG: YafY family transcriptional regulator [Clostridia bacterium]|nr:YafY family transcriptional regulator [Clostridia bacterium]
MKFEIMIGILFDLLSRKLSSAKYLAEKYDVSTRSIYRYINCLSLAGVPIYTVRGNNGGFSVIDTFRLSSTFMTVPEFEKTIETLSAINESVPNKLLTSIITKLKATVKNEYSGFDVKSGNLIIDAGPWGDTVGYKSKLKVISACIEKCNQLLITYRDRNGEKTERVIEPHVIVFKQGLWYVYAYCTLRKTFRFFKTGRIEKAQILNTTFLRREIEKDKLPLDFWHENTTAENVVLEISKSSLSDVEEWLGVENVRESNGKYVAEIKLPFDNGLVMKIMSYGGGVKVIAPKELKEKIKNNAKQILEFYE